MSTDIQFHLKCLHTIVYCLFIIFIIFIFNLLRELTIYTDLFTFLYCFLLVQLISMCACLYVNFFKFRWLTANFRNNFVVYVQFCATNIMHQCFYFLPNLLLFVQVNINQWAKQKKKSVFLCQVEGKKNYIFCIVDLNVALLKVFYNTLTFHYISCLCIRLKNSISISIYFLPFIFFVICSSLSTNLKLKLHP